jgi:hypothetical protein
VVGVAGLDAISSEKGDLAAAADTWPDGSLFRFVDRAFSARARFRPLGEPFTSLVCDDLGTEIADFIGVEEAGGAGASRLSFIHAKWKPDDPGVSASLIYDVCGQAVKNLAYLKPDAAGLPGSRQKWDLEWKFEGGRVPRIRRGDSAADIRTAILRVRADPNAQRAVWIVLGGGILSKQALVRELRLPTPKPHVLQFAHLVLSTHASCQSIGADLRIFSAE